MNSRAVPMRGFTSPKGVLVPVFLSNVDAAIATVNWNSLAHRWHSGGGK